MKNLSVRMKLVVGFGIILILMLASIFLSVNSISIMSDQLEAYGSDTVPNINSLWTMRRNMVSAQRYLVRAFMAESTQQSKEELAKAEAEGKAILETLENYRVNQKNQSILDQLDEVKARIETAGSVRREIATLLEKRTEDNVRQAQDLLDKQYVPAFDAAAALLIDFSITEDDSAKSQMLAGEKASDTAWLLLNTMAAVSLLLTYIIIILIRRSIMNPIKEIENVYEQMSQGNMTAQITYESRDELGNMAKCIKKTNAMLAAYIKDISEKLGSLAAGDMRIAVEQDYIGDFKEIKHAMQKTAAALNHTLQTISVASQQVSLGAGQVASGAHALATGSSEQASSVEELNASISHISGQAVKNAEYVKAATEFMNQVGENVRDSGFHMKQLTDAMENISETSDQITNITKVIEDIAFQTNILALNAAIEAARAGDAGKGFAVVADEVRNLAAKSAEAAKKTAELIRNSVEAVGDGAKVAAITAKILQNVELKTNQVSDSIKMIEQASGEQVVAIDQITQGLGQVSSVIQTNAATAEENSATSEEMSAQAATLKEEVAKFKLSMGQTV